MEQLELFSMNHIHLFRVFRENIQIRHVVKIGAENSRKWCFSCSSWVDSRGLAYEDRYKKP